MTTLIANDITTTSAGVPNRLRVRDSGLEFFSRSRSTAEDADRWSVWLREVMRSPASFEDELVTAPSEAAILIALELLSDLKRIDAPPDIVTLGPNGEIIFERRVDSFAEQIVIYDDLRMDLIVYRNGRLEHRHVIAEPEPTFAW